MGGVSLGEPWGCLGKPNGELLSGEGWPPSMLLQDPAQQQQDREGTVAGKTDRTLWPSLSRVTWGTAWFLPL